MKDPEVIRNTMQHQGISMKMHRENALILHGSGHILGVLRLRALDFADCIIIARLANSLQSSG